MRIQRERLSERDVMYCVYWIRRKDHSDISLEGYVGISKNFKERMRGHKKNRKPCPLVSAIKVIGWDNLYKEIINESLTLEQALNVELKLRPNERIGWNLQKGGNIGVDSSWYDCESNRDKHSKATSKNTKIGILENDTKELRSIRAKESWIRNRTSYKDISKGSNNPKALLTEDQVKDIKYNLIPSGLSNKDISNHFGVKPYVIGFIRNNKNWKHI